jgi:hypothetical protein
VSANTTIQWTERSWSKFVALIRIGAPAQCWEWQAGCFTNGYGQFRVGRRKVRAHRAYYERIIGSVPSGLILRHSCDNRRCCNPTHLTPGTAAENARDRDGRGRGAKNGTSLPGERNPGSKVDLATVLEIRRRAAEGEAKRSIATAIGLSQSQVGNIVRGSSWRDGPWP